MCDETKSAFYLNLAPRRIAEATVTGGRKVSKVSKKKRREIAAPAGRDVGIAVVYESCEAGECLLNTFSKKGENGVITCNRATCSRRLAAQTSQRRYPAVCNICGRCPGIHLYLGTEKIYQEH